MSTARVDQAHLRRLLEREDLDGFVRALERLCHKEAQRIATNGLEYEDILQEARVAVFKAGKAWNPEGGANPLSLATMVVRQHLWSVAGRQLTHNRRVNIETRSLQAPLGHTTATLADRIPERGATTQEILEHGEQLAWIVRQLSPISEELIPGATNRSAKRARRALIGSITKGATLKRQVFYVARRPEIDEAVASRTAQSMNPGAVITSVSKRRLAQGRDLEPDIPVDGGTPVWRFELLVGVTQEAAEQAV